MAKTETTKTAVKASGDRLPRWKMKVDYIEGCNCEFGCPCNFSGYPSGGFC